MISAVLTHGHAGQLPRGDRGRRHEHRDPMLIYVCVVE